MVLIANPIITHHLCTGKVLLESSRWTLTCKNIPNGSVLPLFVVIANMQVELDNDKKKISIFALSPYFPGNSPTDSSLEIDKRTVHVNIFLAKSKKRKLSRIYHLRSDIPFFPAFLHQASTSR